MNNVAMIIGDDIHSQLLTHCLLTDTPSEWAVAVYSSERTAKGEQQEPNFRQYRELETRLFSALVAKNANETDSMEQQLERHFIRHGAKAYDHVTDINSPAFVKTLLDHDIDILVSVRCYQKFGRDILSTFNDAKKGRYLLNLHPGRLPEYRGVL